MLTWNCRKDRKNRLQPGWKLLRKTHKKKKKNKRVKVEGKQDTRPTHPQMPRQQTKKFRCNSFLFHAVNAVNKRSRHCWLTSNKNHYNWLNYKAEHNMGKLQPLRTTPLAKKIDIFRWLAGRPEVRLYE